MSRVNLLVQPEEHRKVGRKINFLFCFYTGNSFLSEPGPLSKFFLVVKEEAKVFLESAGSAFSSK